MMGTKITWSRQEAANLLDGYLEVLKGEQPRLRIIKRVSADLRKMAINNGLEIDDIFRNENGISFQMQSMESAYCGRTVMKAATQLFTEIVTLYRENRGEYEKLLKEARTMIDRKINYKETFSSWLAENIPNVQQKVVLASCDKIEQFCLKLKILKAPLFETTDLDILKTIQKTVSQNKIFRIVNKKHIMQIDTAIFFLIKYIKEGDIEKGSSKNTPTQNVSTLKQPEAQTVSDKSQEAANNVPELYIRTEQDRRLIAKYPIVYRRVFFSLREMFELGQGGTTISALHERINHIARCSDIEDILDNVSWSVCEGRQYLFSEKVVQHDETMNSLDDVTETESVGTEQVNHCLNFTFIDDLTNTKPISFTYFGESVIGFTSWAGLYVALLSNLYPDYTHLLKAGMSFTSSSTGRFDLCDAELLKKMVSPKPIPGTSLYLETNLSAKNIVDKIKFLFDLCQVDYENVVIKY